MSNENAESDNGKNLTSDVSGSDYVDGKRIHDALGNEAEPTDLDSAELSEQTEVKVIAGVEVEVAVDRVSIDEDNMSETTDLEALNKVDETDDSSCGDMKDEDGGDMDGHPAPDDNTDYDDQSPVVVPDSTLSGAEALEESSRLATRIQDGLLDIMDLSESTPAHNEIKESSSRIIESMWEAHNEASSRPLLEAKEELEEVSLAIQELSALESENTHDRTAKLKERLGGVRVDLANFGAVARAREVELRHSRGGEAYEIASKRHYAAKQEKMSSSDRTTLIINIAILLLAMYVIFAVIVPNS